MAKMKKFSKEEIESISKKALEKIDTIKVTKGRRSESESFLLEIKEVIGKALTKEIPFTHISTLVKEMYGIDVSVNILKSFAKNHLDYIPKARTKKLKKLTKCPREIAGSIFSVLKEIRNFIPYGRVTS